MKKTFFNNYTVTLEYFGYKIAKGVLQQISTTPHKSFNPRENLGDTINFLETADDLPIALHELFSDCINSYYDINLVNKLPMATESYAEKFLTVLINNFAKYNTGGNSVDKNI